MNQAPTPDYNFILNSQQKQKQSLFPGGGSQKGRIFLVVSVLAIILVLGIIIASLIGGQNKGLAATLQDAAYSQQEFIRLSEIAMEKATSSETKNYATTINTVMKSDQAALLPILAKAGSKVTVKTLAARTVAGNDTILTTAEQSNRFDEDFTKLMQRDLIAYQQFLRKAYPQVGAETKEVLATQIENTVVLINNDK